MSRRMVMALLAGLILASAAPHDTSRSSGWLVFLYGVPLALIGCLLANHRWALLAAVMYGTVGLALDISTIVQELAKPDGVHTPLVTSGVTGLLNVLLIVFGWKGFLTETVVSTPPESPRSSPPSPSSS